MIQNLTNASVKKNINGVSKSWRIYLSAMLPIFRRINSVYPLPNLKERGGFRNLDVVTEYYCFERPKFYVLLSVLLYLIL